MCDNNIKNRRKEEHCECGGHLSRFIEPRLLLLLREKESYGYELIDRINEFSFFGTPIDPGAVYRTLRRMECENLVISRWDTKETGPARRIYCITKDGEDRLYGWVVNLKKRKEALEKFLKIYGRR